MSCSAHVLMADLSLAIVCLSTSSFILLHLCFSVVYFYVYFVVVRR